MKYWADWDKSMMSCQQMVSSFAKREYNSVARRKGVSIPPTTAALRHDAGTDDFHRAKESGSWASSCKDREPATASERRHMTDRRPRAAISSSRGRRLATSPPLGIIGYLVKLATVKSSPLT
ncbi:uncharacterized protein FFB14_15304 [Fusarium fujikuroi]|nr:uncharacterized protein FFB14_15304 [Fusarium fujikuroi]